MEDTPTETHSRKPAFAWKTLLVGAVLGVVVGVLGLSALVLGSYAFFQKKAVIKMAETKELSPLLLRADLEWSVTDIQGETVSMTSFSGRPLLLHFWNPTCVSCVAEIPSLNALYERFEAQGLAFAAVALHGEDSLAVDVAANDIRFPVYRGDLKGIPPVFKATATPTTCIVDPDGFIVLRHAGAVDWMAGDGPAYLERLTTSTNGHAAHEP